LHRTVDRYVDHPRDDRAARQLLIAVGLKKGRPLSAMNDAREEQTLVTEIWAVAPATVRLTSTRARISKNFTD
jgi:hypothetical protein